MTFYLQQHLRRPGRKLLPFALRPCRFYSPTVLGTLFFSGILPSEARECLLQTRWKGFWTSHDANSIRAVQDAFNCCGFRTIKDMAWPFPHGNPKEPQSTCESQFGRTLACRVPWEQALQQNNGTGLAITIFTAVIQIANVFPPGVIQRQRAAEREPDRASLVKWFKLG